jgi:hypothetical protein
VRILRTSGRTHDGLVPLPLVVGDGCEPGALFVPAAPALEVPFAADLVDGLALGAPAPVLVTVALPAGPVPVALGPEAVVLPAGPVPVTLGPEGLVWVPMTLTVLFAAIVLGPVVAPGVERRDEETVVLGAPSDESVVGAAAKLVL